MEALLFGPPDPATSRRAARDTSTGTGTAPTTSSGESVRHPSPEMWAAFLASARRRRDRTRCPWPRTELPEITAEDIASTLVGAYVLTPEVRQRIRQARQFAEAS
ncbi:hypothetical protein ACFU53_22440 [Streptomyces sp. NPDC057474]|uniref:hypothetical protein n=1 Tax=Streptomyces sp. NPDC057474 TaxID=3346144 RepID=UPI0036783317